MNILLLSPLPPPCGGISRWTEILIKKTCNIADVNIKHINTSPKYCGNVTFLKRVIFGAVSVFDIFYKMFVDIDIKEIDVLHLTSSGSLGMIRDWLCLKYAKFYSVRTVYHLHYGRIPQMIDDNTLEWKMLKRIINDANYTIVLDTITLEKLKRECPHCSLTFCPNPIDTIRTDELIVPFFKREKKIVFIGHVIKTKGIDELISAWDEISIRHPDYLLEVIGSSYDDLYVEKFGMKKNVRFVGCLDHNMAMKELSFSTALVLPSYTEGFPNVILEAMALKVPIVATRVGAIPEMLGNECGIVINPHSILEIEKAINFVILNTPKCFDMANKSYNKVKSNYDDDVVVNRYVNIWRKLIEK